MHRYFSLVTHRQSMTGRSSISSERGGGALTTTVIVLVVLILAVGAYLFFEPGPTPMASHKTSSTSTDATEANAPTTEATELIQRLAGTTSLRDNYPEANLTASTNTTDSAPLYQYNGDDFYMSGDFGTKLSVATSTMSQTTINQLASATSAAADTLFNQSGLTKSTISAGSISGYNTLTDYQDSGVICQVDTIVDQTPIISCAEKSSYQTPASQMQPIATAYYASNAAAAPNTEFMDATITDKSGGYANASVYVGDVAADNSLEALFYAQNNQWNYLGTTDNYVYCSMLTTPASEAAFAGETCETDQGQSTKVTTSAS